MAGIQLTGLASGMDWRSVVDQLMQLDRVPQDRLRTQQTSITQQSTALDRIKGKLSTLQTSLTDLAFSSSSASTRSTTVLSSLFQEYTGGVATSTRVNQTSTATVSATSSATLGTYKVEVTKMGSPYTVISKNTTTDSVAGLLERFGSFYLNDLPLGADITTGSVFVNGVEITVGPTSDPAASNHVDPSTTTLTELNEMFKSLSSLRDADQPLDPTNPPPKDYLYFTGDGSSPVAMNTAADSSNLIDLLGLAPRDSTALDYISSFPLTNVSQTTKIGDLSSFLNSSLGLPALAESGSFSINGESIEWNEDDTISSVVSRINDSDAGVSASYSRVDGKLMIVSKEGGKAITFDEDEGNLLQNLGVVESNTSGGFSLAGTITSSVYEYKVTKDGVSVGTGKSFSDTLNLSDLGFDGVSLKVTETGTTTFTVGADSTASTAKVKAFIDAYNAVRQDIEDSTKVTSADGKVTTSVLSGNRDLMAVASSLRKFIFTPMTGPTFQATGDGGSKLTVSLAENGSWLDQLKVGAEVSGSGVSAGSKITAIEKVKDGSGSLTGYEVTISGAVANGSVSVKSASTARYTQMEQLGLAFRGTAGDLYIKDSGKLQAALTSYSSDVEKFFTSVGVPATSSTPTTFEEVYPTHGVAERLDGYLNKIIGYNGLFEIQKKSLTSRSKTIDKQIADMERLLKQRQAALERSFIQMEQAQQQVQTQLSALTGSLSGFSSSAAKK